MSISKARIGGLLLLAFSLFYAWKIGDIRLLPFQANQSFTPRTMPQVLAVLAIMLSLAIIALGGDKDPRRLAEPFKKSERDQGLNWPLGLAFLVLMSVYGFAVRPLGFLLSTSLFLMIGFAMLGERSPVKLVSVAVPLVVCFWALMNYGLSVFIEPLPFFLRG
ncbi:MAG: tripartite tricarboxylate transporter TctB family protein [Pseudomonadota bacterium]